MILFLFCENCSYLKSGNNFYFMSLYLQPSPLSVSRHLANHTSCKWMLLLSSPLFYRGINQTPAIIVSLLSLILNTLSWADVCWQTRLKLKRSSSQQDRLSAGWLLLVCKAAPTVSAGCVSATGSVSSGVCASATILTTLTHWTCPNLLDRFSLKLWMFQKIILKSKNDKKESQKSISSLYFITITLYNPSTELCDGKMTYMKHQMFLINFPTQKYF